jgi:RimJ/RimL family protein N-acetyltransferase
VYTIIIGQNVFLRGLEVTDADIIRKYWNSSELQQYMSKPRIVSKEEEEAWIRKSWEIRYKGEAYIFGIMHIDEKQYIGNIELRMINTIAKRGMLGIMIFNPDYWGKGYGEEAIKLILQFGFETLNLKTVELEVFDFNKRAQMCYKKVGFVEIGKKRDAHFAKGQFYDVIIMDITSEEFTQYKLQRE